MNKKLISVAVACVAIVSVSAVSPELNAPRVGDTLKIIRLAEQPATTDSTGLILDLSRTDFRGTFDFTCWQPSRLDSLSDMLIVSDREIYRLVTKDKHQYILDRSTPGITRHFESDVPYALFPDSLKNVAAESRGRMDGVGIYRSEGDASQKTVSGLSVILAGGDTIRNVECMVTDTRELVEVTELDTTYHINRICRWYAPGYRYPIVTGEKTISLTLDGDTVDIVSNWTACLPAGQEEQIDDDPVNEMIRASIAENDKPHTNPIPSSNKGHTPGREVCSFDRDRQEITINRTFSSPGVNEYIIGDFAGHVYAHGELSSSTPTAVVSTVGYLPGGYFIHLTTDSEPVVYKFFIEQ